MLTYAIFSNQQNNLSAFGQFLYPCSRGREQTKKQSLAWDYTGDHIAAALRSLFLAGIIRSDSDSMF